jgi:hypothetical protein
MQDIEILKKQYKNAQNLRTRISLHDKYSKNKQGFGNWIFEIFSFSTVVKFLNSVAVLAEYGPAAQV